MGTSRILGMEEKKEEKQPLLSSRVPAPPTRNKYWPPAPWAIAVLILLFVLLVVVVLFAVVGPAINSQACDGNSNLSAVEMQMSQQIAWTTTFDVKEVGTNQTVGTYVSEPLRWLRILDFFDANGSKAMEMHREFFTWGAQYHFETCSTDSPIAEFRVEQQVFTFLARKYRILKKDSEGRFSVIAHSEKIAFGSTYANITTTDGDVVATMKRPFLSWTWNIKVVRPEIVPPVIIGYLVVAHTIEEHD
eukprot:c6199_g1_i1.p1 GENE.c6199_g1_i1~~c6199_g1_i1.p1  ORF type:complete len:247 (+),score=39.87 c6199_g1_i1:1-741(+)